MQTGISEGVTGIFEGVNYSGDKCVYRAKSQRYLMIHKQAIHEGAKYLCDQCVFRATSQRYLKTHKTVMHGGARYSWFVM